MGKKVWVARDDDGDYVVGALAKRITKGSGVFGSKFWMQADRQGDEVQVCCCPRHFERVFPNIRLAPGEGPIRVELTARVCEEGE